MDGCLGDETIAAYVDGALEHAAIAQIDHHIDTCASCRAQLSAVVERSTPAGVADAIARGEPGGVAIGRYVLEDVIGRGGMGVVVRARDPELERTVAIKLVDPWAPRGASSGGWRARLRDEARAMARLRHPNVVTVYDAGAVGNQVFVAMELVDGESLAKHLARDRGRALALCIAAGRGLCAAHAAGLAHGDVKPDNILVDRDGRALIGDFGLTRTVESANDGALVGTPAYMAPELLRRKPADALSDQFAFAVTVYEACSGARPWRAASVDALADTIEHEPPAKPAAMSRAVWRVVARGLAPAREARWPSLASFVDALERAARPARPLRRIAWGVAAVALAGGGVAVATRAPAATCVDPIERTRALTIACGAGPACTALQAELANRASAWRHTHVGVCSATRDGTQSAELLDRRMHCLDERLLEHVALAERVATPGDAFDALAALHRLESPESCATADRAVVGVAPAQAAALADAERWLASAKADLALGHYAQGKAALAPHVEAMLALAPLAAEAANVYGQLQLQTGDLDGAEHSFDLGLHAAATAGDDAATADLLLERAYLLGESRQQWSRGAEALRAAEVAVARAGRPRELATRLLLEQGLMAEDTGDFATARTQYTRALELRRTFAPPTDVALALERVCAAEHQLGKLDDARAHCEEAVRLLRGALGELHPLVAEAESNLAVAIAITGDLRGARTRWEAALATLERGLGDDAPGLAAVLLDLDDVARTTGDDAAADRYLARALNVTADAASSPENIDVRIRVANQLRSSGKPADGLAMLGDLARRAEATLGALHPSTAHAYEDLGAAYYDAERYADARAAWDKAMTASTALYGANHPTTLTLAGRIGQAMMEMHDAKAARPVFEHAVLALEAATKPDSPFLAQAYTNLADCLTTLGEPVHALEPAAKGLAIREQRGDDPLQTSEARFVLAQATWHAGRPGAVAMARTARDEMRAIGPRATSLPDVEHFLRQAGGGRH